MLYWVLRGRALIDVDAVAHTASAGKALWVPGGVRTRIRVTRSDVVVPVPGLSLGSICHPTALDVPASWGPWLFQAFGESLGYLDWDADSGLDRLQQALSSASRGQRSIAPPAPLSSELNELTNAVVLNPALSIGELLRGRWAGWTPRTLQRRFLSETGLTPSQWQQRHRVDRAISLIAAGKTLGAAANAVGYQTVDGLGRQFRRYTGLSPEQWRRRQESSFSAPQLDEAPPFESVSEQRTWFRVNGAHVAVWMMRGGATLTLGDRTVRVAEGEAITLPAGLPNTISIDRGSLMLPLGFRAAREMPELTPISPVDVSSLPEADLIQAVVASYTSIRPPGFDPRTGFEYAQEHLPQHGGPVIPNAEVAPADLNAEAVLAYLAGGLASGAIREATLAECARWLNLPERRVGELITQHTGLGFAQWTRASRMSRARAMLHRGEAAATISRTLGYAHLPAFSRAFRDVHGVPPTSLAPSSPGGGEQARWARSLAQKLQHSG